MTVTINGQTGVDTPGLASYTMPTSGGDAVVESGSNSDGEWTRWADGTQICLGEASESFTTDLVGQLYRSISNSVFTFPMSFSASPVFSGDTNSSLSMVSSTSISTTEIGFRILSSIDLTNEGAYTCRVSATGRWK